MGRGSEVWVCVTRTSIGLIKEFSDCFFCMLLWCIVLPSLYVQRLFCIWCNCIFISRLWPYALSAFFNVFWVSQPRNMAKQSRKFTAKGPLFDYCIKQLCFINVERIPQKSNARFGYNRWRRNTFMSVLESLMWQLRGVSECLLEMIRSKRQSLPGWTLDLELLWWLTCNGGNGPWSPADWRVRYTKVNDKLSCFVKLSIVNFFFSYDIICWQPVHFWITYYDITQGQMSRANFINVNFCSILMGHLIWHENQLKRCVGAALSSYL